MDNYNDTATKEAKLEKKQKLVDDTIKVGKLSQYEIIKRMLDGLVLEIEELKKILFTDLSVTNESKEKAPSDLSSRLAIFLLFAPCLLALCLLILWNHLDPTRVFLLNCIGLYLGWIVINAILTMRNSNEYGAIGKGVSRLLAGICIVDALAVSFFIPSLIAPCCLAQFFAQILQKKFAAT